MPCKVGIPPEASAETSVLVAVPLSAGADDFRVRRRLDAWHPFPLSAGGNHVTTCAPCPRAPRRRGRGRGRGRARELLPAPVSKVLRPGGCRAVEQACPVPAVTSDEDTVAQAAEAAEAGDGAGGYAEHHAE